MIEVINLLKAVLSMALIETVVLSRNGLHAYSTLFIVCNSVVCTNTFNILSILYNGHIVLNCTVYFVHRPLNSYFIYIGYWTLNIIIMVTVRECSSRYGETRTGDR